MESKLKEILYSCTDREVRQNRGNHVISLYSKVCFSPYCYVVLLDSRHVPCTGDIER